MFQFNKNDNVSKSPFYHTNTNNDDNKYVRMHNKYIQTMKRH